MNRVGRKTLEDIVLDAFIYICLIFLVVVTLYPFLNTLAVSFNDAMDSSRGGITLWPRVFTLYNYQTLLTRSQIYHATLVSAARTILSTAIGTFCTAMAAYIISRREFVLRRLVSFI